MLDIPPSTRNRTPPVLSLDIQTALCLMNIPFAPA